MNNGRRKALSKLHAMIEEIKGKLEDANSEIETLKDEEQDYYDNMPESLQGGEKGEKAQSAIDALEEVNNSLDDIVGNLDDVLSKIDEAGE